MERSTMRKVIRAASLSLLLATATGVASVEMIGASAVMADGEQGPAQQGPAQDQPQPQPTKPDPSKQGGLPVIGNLGGIGGLGGL
jgi:hypothetical protein